MSSGNGSDCSEEPRQNLHHFSKERVQLKPFSTERTQLQQCKVRTRQRVYSEKLKNDPERYMLYKQKERQRAVRYRERLKDGIGTTTEEMKRKGRERQRRYRQQKKQMVIGQQELQILPIEYVQTAAIEPIRIDAQLQYDHLDSDETLVLLISFMCCKF